MLGQEQKIISDVNGRAKRRPLIKLVVGVLFSLLLSVIFIYCYVGFKKETDSFFDPLIKESEQCNLACKKDGCSELFGGKNCNCESYCHRVGVPECEVKYKTKINVLLCKIGF